MNDALAGQLRRAVAEDGPAVVVGVAGQAPVAELVVSPDDRGHGVGEALVAELAEHAPDGMSLWAHGRSASAAFWAGVAATSER